MRPSPSRTILDAMAKSRPITISRAVAAIEKFGILLVYPIDNRKEPVSLWSAFYRDEMRWEWDDGADDRVSHLWHIRTELSTSREVVYVKWFRGRATFFSKKIFTALLAYFETPKLSPAQLNHESQLILEVLEMDSPQSTKQLKLATDLKGKLFERTYEKSMKALFEKLWIVGFGEVDDGAFPSLATGSTKALFEELWEASQRISKKQAHALLLDQLGEESLFFKQVLKIGAK